MDQYVGYDKSVYDSSCDSDFNANNNPNNACDKLTNKKYTRQRSLDKVNNKYTCKWTYGCNSYFTGKADSDNSEYNTNTVTRTIDGSKHQLNYTGNGTRVFDEKYIRWDDEGKCDYTYKYQCNFNGLTSFKNYSTYSSQLGSDFYGKTCYKYNNECNDTSKKFTREFSIITDNNKYSCQIDLGCNTNFNGKTNNNEYNTTTVTRTIDGSKHQLNYTGNGTRVFDEKYIRWDDEGKCDYTYKYQCNFNNYSSFPGYNADKANNSCYLYNNECNNTSKKYTRKFSIVQENNKYTCKVEYGCNAKYANFTYDRPAYDSSKVYIWEERNNQPVPRLGMNGANSSEIKNNTWNSIDKCPSNNTGTHAVVSTGPCGHTYTLSCYSSCNAKIKWDNVNKRYTCEEPTCSTYTNCGDQSRYPNRINAASAYPGCECTCKTGTANETYDSAKHDSGNYYETPPRILNSCTYSYTLKVCGLDKAWTESPTTSGNIENFSTDINTATTNSYPTCTKTYTCKDSNKELKRQSNGKYKCDCKQYNYVFRVAAKMITYRTVKETVGIQFNDFHFSETTKTLAQDLYSKIDPNLEFTGRNIYTCHVTGYGSCQNCCAVNKGKGTYIFADDGTILYSSSEYEPDITSITYNGCPYSVTAGVFETSPIVLDLKGDGFKYTSIEDGANFDLDADGNIDRTGWTAKQDEFDDAFLVLDKNGDGQVNSGSELFGDQNGEENGYKELAKYDDNKDGKIDKNDAVYSQLRLWADMNGDGKVDHPQEWKTLEEMGVKEISIRYEKVYDEYGNSLTDEYGNDVSLKGSFKRVVEEVVDGVKTLVEKTLDMVDVFFNYISNIFGGGE